MAKRQISSLHQKPLNDLFKCLLEIHRYLLDAERPAASIKLGREPSPYEFLNMLLTDENFSWIKPFTTLLSDIDILSEEITENDHHRLVEVKARVHQLFYEAKEVHPSVAHRFHDLIKESIEVGVLKKELERILSSAWPGQQ